MLTQDLIITDPSDFEKVVALEFQRLGYEVIMPPVNTKGYDIELRKDQECIAVQVKNHKAKCSLPKSRNFKIS
jgi:chromosome partitioning protein